MPPNPPRRRDIVDTFDTAANGALTVERTSPTEVYLTAHDGADMTGMRLTHQEVGRLAGALLTAAKLPTVIERPPRHLTVVAASLDYSAVELQVARGEPSDSPPPPTHPELEEVPRSDDSQPGPGLP